MTTQDDFVRAIIADPGNPFLRLVYSDWLEEQGREAEAEFVRMTANKWDSEPHANMSDLSFGKPGSPWIRHPWCLEEELFAYLGGRLHGDWKMYKSFADSMTDLLVHAPRRYAEAKVHAEATP